MVEIEFAYPKSVKGMKKKKKKKELGERNPILELKEMN